MSHYATRSATHSSMAPIDEEILQDHMEVKDHYAHYKKTGDIKWANQFFLELCRHSVGEELVFYPALAKLGGKGESLAETSLNEHNEIKELVSEMMQLEQGSKKFDATFDKLFKMLEEHIELEETEDVPLVKKLMSQEDRVQCGRLFHNRKMLMPSGGAVASLNALSFNDVATLFLSPSHQFKDLFSQ